jgi:hypothetical protein
MAGTVVIECRKYGTGWELHCSECGQVDFTPFDYRYTNRDVWDHRRHAHPTEDEQIQDELRRAERELEGYCGRCGQRGHEDVECPNAQPWHLKRTTED